MTTATTTGAALRARAARQRGALADVLGRLDWILIGTIAALLAFSTYIVDLSRTDDVGVDPVASRVVHIALGVLILAAMYLVNLHWVARWSWVLLGVLLGALTVVFLIGTVARGSTRWITVGPLNVQPSEIGKIILIVVLAAVLSERARLIGTAQLSLLALLVAATPAAVIFIEPDLGTAIVYFAIAGGMLLVAGAPWRHFAVAGAAAAAAALLVLGVLPAMGAPVLQDYQVDRLTAFVDSDRSPQDAGYQLRASKTAIGSGGATGKGASGATQTINDFLPEHHTDFIFAVVGEMFGFIGAASVIVLFGLVIWRAIRIAENAPTHFDQLVVAGVVAMIGFQVFVNIGMTVGIMPITGIPLPFMSFGGSHTIATLAAVGMLLRIHSKGGAGSG